MGFLSVLLLIASLLAPVASDADQFGNWSKKVGILDILEVLNSVTYGNGIFVAVGNGGMILTSADGSKWTIRDSDAGSDLNGVVFVNDVFIAVGGGGTILTSSNGIKWTSRYTVISDTLKSVAYGNGIYVAVGDAILTSTDGETWTEKKTNYDSLTGIAFGNGMFAAVGDQGRVIRSPNGSTWSATYLDGSLNTIIFSESKFVTAGIRLHLGGSIVLAGQVYSSPDGITWTDKTNEEFYSIYSLAYGNDLFVGTGLNGVLISSPDGETWKQEKDISTPLFFGIAYGNGVYVAVGTGGIFKSGTATPGGSGGKTTLRPVISVSPKSLDLGSATGDETVERTITISNTGSATLDLSQIAITKQKVKYFSVIDDCFSLAPYEFCEVVISFSPASGSKAGKKIGGLAIVSNDNKNPLVLVPLTGVVVTPKISAKPTLVDGGVVKVGSSITRTLTIKNTGGAELIISSVSLTGAKASEFTQTRNCIQIDNSSSIQAGGSCSFTITFTPTSKGTKSATLTVASNDPSKATLDIKLAGRGK